MDKIYGIDYTEHYCRLGFIHKCRNKSLLYTCEGDMLKDLSELKVHKDISDIKIYESRITKEDYTL